VSLSRCEGREATELRGGWLRFVGFFPVVVVASAKHELRLPCGYSQLGTRCEANSVVSSLDRLVAVGAISFYLAAAADC
jgi:hypothetical protein